MTRHPCRGHTEASVAGKGDMCSTLPAAKRRQRGKAACGREETLNIASGHTAVAGDRGSVAGA
uniref:Uncharacterized protein n=2 Tax=Oryza TaxID=4527 RepID=A0A0D3GEC7_9ORYZ